MTGFDILVLIIVGTAAIGGFLRGFVQEVLSLSAWAVVVVAIRYLHTDLTALVFDFVGSPSGASVIAFALLLLVPYAIVRLIARKAGKSSRASVLGPIDRVLGFGFGMIKGLIIVILAFSMLVLVYDSVWGPSGRPLWITEARTYSFIKASSEEMVQLIAERRRALLDGDQPE